MLNVNFLTATMILKTRKKTSIIPLDRGRESKRQSLRGSTGKCRNHYYSLGTGGGKQGTGNEAPEDTPQFCSLGLRKVVFSHGSSSL